MAGGRITALAAAISVACALQQDAAAFMSAETLYKMRMARSIQVWQEEENLLVKLFRFLFVTGEAPGPDHALHLQREHTIGVPKLRQELRDQRGAHHQGRSVGSATSGGSATSLGAEVELDDQGYATVVDAGRTSDMELFVRRVIADRGLRVSDEDNFHDVLRYYNGECATQNFRQLLAELDRGQKYKRCRRVWLNSADNSTNPTNTMHLLSNVKVLGSLGVGKTVSMDELGYKKVARTKDDGEMSDFVHRAIKLMDMEVVDDWGMRNFVPYHSGTCGTRSYVNLVGQLEHAASVPRTCGGGWVRRIHTAAEED